MTPFCGGWGEPLHLAAPQLRQRGGGGAAPLQPELHSLLPGAPPPHRPRPALGRVRQAVRLQRCRPWPGESAG